MVNLIKVSEFNESILVIHANHYLFCNLTTTFQHPPLFFVYNGAFDIARSVRNVSGCTLLRDVKLACNKH